MDLVKISDSALDALAKAILAAARLDSGVRMTAKDPHTGLPGSVPAPAGLSGIPESQIFAHEFTPLPDKDSLRKILDVCIASSMFVDEGRHATFRIVVANTEFTRPQSISLVPLEFLAKNVGRLAMCCTANSGALAVDVSASRIVAILESTTASYSELSFFVGRPGSVVISVMGRECARIDNLELKIVQPASIDRYSALTAVASALSIRDFSKGLKVASAFLRIGAMMRDIGHGGTLLVSPTQNVLSKPFKFPASSAAVRLAMEPVNLPDNIDDHLRAALERSHSEVLTAALRLVAATSQTDGAVLMTPEMDLHGFGCFVEVGSDALPPVRPVDGYDLDQVGSAQTVSAQQIGGARHQSAIRFVHGNPDSVAIVASQDGGLTLAIPIGNEVAVLRSIVGI